MSYHADDSDLWRLRLLAISAVGLVICDALREFSSPPGIVSILQYLFVVGVAVSLILDYQISRRK